MALTKVMILGGTGMLGDMLVRCLARNSSLRVTASYRLPSEPIACEGVTWHKLDAATVRSDGLRWLTEYDWIINAIGLIKQRIYENDQQAVHAAIRLNALFPHEIALAIRGTSTRLLQIATDCVYDGAAGAYTELQAHNPLDIYGKTKSLGEVAQEGIINLRTSIIGPHRPDGVSLLDWFLSRPIGVSITGYTNHHWNGITTLHFAKITQAVISAHATDLPRQGTFHLVPADRVTKAELLALFQQHIGRSDLKINYDKASESIDRTLTITHETLNRLLWQLAGYSTPPSIETMVKELADWMEHDVASTYPAVNG